MIINKMIPSISLFIILLIPVISEAQGQQAMEPEDTEVWEPVPQKINPRGFTDKSPTDDAVILFNGEDLAAWQSSLDGKGVQWKVTDGFMQIVPGTGAIETRQSFGSVQMHIEWRVPADINGEGQDRGNSGIFFQEKYELQVLDSYDNKTYVNGMAGSIYKQHIPLVNAAREPGEWQSYDVIFIAPQFGETGALEAPAYMTVFWNGIMIHNNVALEGHTQHTGIPEYQPHDAKLPISLQDHDHPVHFRNIWVREL